MDRDVFLFAAGAVLTALAVKYASYPWLWDGTIYVGVAVMTLGAADFLARKLRIRDRPMFAILGMIVCGGGFLTFAAWYFWSAPMSANATHLAGESIAPASATTILPKPKPKILTRSIAGLLGEGRTRKTNTVPSVLTAEDIFQLNVHRDPILSQLRLLWINSHDNVPADIAQGMAWPPKEWLNQMLAAYERDWRVKTLSGRSFIGTPYQVTIPPENSGRVYNHGIAAPVLTDWQRTVFRMTLSPPSFPQPVTFYMPSNLAPEEESYQKQIAAIFPSDGGRTVNIASGPDIDKIVSEHTGIVLFVNDPERIFGDEKSVMDAFTAAKLQATAERNPDTKNGWLGILVGPDKKYELMKALKSGTF